MRYTLIALVAIFALSGCSTPAERAARNRIIDARDDAECRKYGATYGTAAYANCRVAIASRRSAEEDQAISNAILYNQQLNQPSNQRSR